MAHMQLQKEGLEKLQPSYNFHKNAKLVLLFWCWNFLSIFLWRLWELSGDVVATLNCERQSAVSWSSKTPTFFDNENSSLFNLRELISFGE